MTKLNLENVTTGEVLEVSDINFSEVTPKDIITELGEYGWPYPKDSYPEYTDLRFFKRGCNEPLDNHTTLDKLGIKDGDTVKLIFKIRFCSA